MPTLSPSESLRLMKQQRDKGRRLLAAEVLDGPVSTRWQKTTREFISQAFGADSGNAKDFKRTPMLAPGADHHRSNLERQLNIVESCIEQLEALPEVDTLIQVERLQRLLFEYRPSREMMVGLSKAQLERMATGSGPTKSAAAVRTEILELYGAVEETLVAHGFQTHLPSLGNLPVVATAVSDNPSLKQEAGHCLHHVLPALDVVIGRLKTESTTVTEDHPPETPKPIIALVANARKHPAITLAVGAIGLVVATTATNWCVFDKVVHQPKIDALSHQLKSHTAPNTPASVSIPDEIKKCPLGLELAGTVGIQQWCQRREGDGNFTKHGAFVKWQGCIPLAAAGSGSHRGQAYKGIGASENSFPCIVAEKGAFVDGKRDDLWVRFYPNAVKQQEVTYKNGELVGSRRQWYDTGVLQLEAVHTATSESYVGWRTNGRKEKEGEFVNGQHEGQWIEYDEQGRPLFEVTYRRGVEVARKKLQ